MKISMKLEDSIITGWKAIFIMSFGIGKMEE